MKTSASEPGLTILYYDNQCWYPDFGLFEKLTLTRSISIYYNYKNDVQDSFWTQPWMIAPLNCLIMQLGLLPPIDDIIRAIMNSFCYIKSARLTVMNILLHILNMRGLHMVIYLHLHFLRMADVNVTT